MPPPPLYAYATVALNFYLNLLSQLLLFGWSPDLFRGGGGGCERYFKGEDSLSTDTADS